MKKILVVLCVLFTPLLVQAKECVNSKPCGNSCIAKDKDCHIGTTTSTSKSKHHKKTAVAEKTGEKTTAKKPKHQTKTDHKTKAAKHTQEATNSKTEHMSKIQKATDPIEPQTDQNDAE